MKNTDHYSEWQRTNAQIFWGEVAPCDHVVQIYEDDELFLDMLAGFTGGGINAGDCVIIIATNAHLKALEERLKSLGVHTEMLIAEDSYIPLNAEETLAKFMINGWPDENLFNDLITGVLKRGRSHNRHIRAFGEMVALLWAQGHNGATVHLEHLWNKFCEKESFSLFCAYPKSGFTLDMHSSITHICAAHSKIITNSDKPMTELLYKNMAGIDGMATGLSYVSIEQKAAV